MKDVISESFIEQNGKPDVIILDPPRAGVHPDVVDVIVKVRPSKIVYVSCNPATQARDISIMKDLYQITKVQPVDMFPHTHHLENVVLLELKNG
jgi:23S rRNA (uracil1939-C5)-methyltransferase